MSYRVFEIELDDLVSSYRVCVPKDYIEQFIKSLENSTALAFSDLHDTDDECECDYVYDPKTGEVPTDCEDDWEDEEWE